MLAGQWKVQQLFIIRFFSRNARAFVEASVSKMKATFPLADPVLKLLPIIDPKNRVKYKPSHIVTLAKALAFSATEVESMENEWLDFLAEDEFEGSPTACWGKVAMASVPNLTKLLRALMTLPHSNASSERVFSMLKKIFSDERSQLKQSTLRSLLSVKMNLHGCCTSSEFTTAMRTKIKRAAASHNARYSKTSAPLPNSGYGDDLVIESGDEADVALISWCS
jgi:hypothetical protein